MQYLGPHYRFKTEVLGNRNDKGSINGPLYIWGNGDPTLVPERLWYLSNLVLARGVREVNNSVYVDDSFFSGARLSNGQEQDTSSYAYMAPRGAVSLGFNALFIQVSPSADAGNPPDILIRPKSDYATIQNNATTTGRGRTKLVVEVVADGDRSRVQISGRISRRDKGRAYYRRVDNPGLFTGLTFKALLKSLGVDTDDARVEMKPLPQPRPKRLAVLHSEPLADIVQKVNRHSNNFMTEQIALALGAKLYGAPGNWDKAYLALQKFMKEKIGVLPGAYKVGNASGLHDVNEVTPRQLVQVLQYMFDQPELAPEYMASMAVAGRSGNPRWPNGRKRRRRRPSRKDRNALYSQCPKRLRDQRQSSARSVFAYCKSVPVVDRRYLVRPRRNWCSDCRDRPRLQ